MTTKIGRPKSNNPKVKQLGVRFDTESLQKLDALVLHYNKTRVEILRLGVNRLYEELPR